MTLRLLIQVFFISYQYDSAHRHLWGCMQCFYNLQDMSRCVLPTRFCLERERRETTQRPFQTVDGLQACISPAQLLLGLCSTPIVQQQAELLWKSVPSCEGVPAACTQ